MAGPGTPNPSPRHYRPSRPAEMNQAAGSAGWEISAGRARVPARERSRTHASAASLGTVDDRDCSTDQPTAGSHSRRSTRSLARWNSDGLRVG